MYTDHTHCRACGSPDRLSEVLDLGVTPLVNDFRKPGEDRAGYAPLKLLLCERCQLPQLSVVVDPHVLYGDYPYIHSDSAGLRQQFATLTDFMQKYRPALGSVLEFGSNDGLYLSTLKGLPGVERVFGIDPATKLVVAAQQRGVSSHCALFSERVAEEIGEPYDTIVARHVFSHIDDWRGVIRGLAKITHKDSIVAIEVQYAPDLLAKTEWDQIYHEHLSYMTLRGLMELVYESPFFVADVRHTEWMGGSIIAILRRKEAGYYCPPNVLSTTNDESVGAKPWKAFGERFRQTVWDMQSSVSCYKYQGVTVWGYGAPAKAANWIHQCGFAKADIRWVTDTTPFKQGALVPGSNIPVVSRDSVPRLKNDQAAILFAWNFEKEIVAKEQEFLREGGKLVVPLPQLRVVGLANPPTGA